MPSVTHWRKLNTWNPMRLRNCKRCGKPYETDRPDTYLCPACSVEAKRETVVRDRICRQCGVVFSGGATRLVLSDMPRSAPAGCCQAHKAHRPISAAWQHRYM